ncbi:MAG: NAD(P)/FAD-dependent oxidoreductase [candidate division NC10 bacterium]|nr:NAD(P)/FAD-dependent oxidoreductase [candidate division NC10 bacterium]
MNGLGYDVAVVGAGMGGLATACLLAKAGRSVILVDRAPRAGGVCQSLVTDGFRFDIGATLLPGFGPGGPLATLCQRLGISVPIKECDPAFQVALPAHRVSLWATPAAWWREVRREFPDEETGWRALWSELESLAAERDRALREMPPLPPEGWGDRLRVWRVVTMGPASSAPTHAGGTLKRSMATSLRATMVRHGLGPGSQRVLDAVLWYLLLRDADACSTLEAAVALQRVRQGVVAVAGGMAALVEALVGRFQQDGGQLRLETPVARLLVEGHRVAGLVTGGGETIRARWLVANVPPDVLTGTLLPPRRGWWERRRAVDGPWQPTLVAQAMLLSVPEALLPSELSGHCFVVADPQRPAREENLVFIRTAPAVDEGQAPAGTRCLTVGRFVAPRPGGQDDAMASDLLEAVDRIVPGVASAMVFHRALAPADLAEAWGRPSAAARYSLDTREWLGERGLPHRLGWPGLLAVGEWTYPGRLICNVAEGAMRVADLISESA